MTDEELGRAWAEKNGLRPDHRPATYNPNAPWLWVYDDGPAYALPREVHKRLGKTRHRTEADAYSAVGAALREVAAECDLLRVIADEVKAIEGVDTSAD